MTTRRLLAALVLACGLALPALSAPIVTYATRGVVTALSRTELVVSRPKNRGPITFALSEVTHVNGALRLGSTVSVRYHDDKGRHLATAVTVEGPINGN